MHAKVGMRVIHVCAGCPSTDCEVWGNRCVCTQKSARLRIMCVQAVRALLEEGADANAADKDGNTPLMTAAYGGHPDTVRALIHAGVCTRDLTDTCRRVHPPLDWVSSCAPPEFH